jgi:hypothetical protein
MIDHYLIAGVSVSRSFSMPFYTLPKLKATSAVIYVLLSRLPTMAPAKSGLAPASLLLRISINTARPSPLLHTIPLSYVHFSSCLLRPSSVTLPRSLALFRLHYSASLRRFFGVRRWQSALQALALPDSALNTVIFSSHTGYRQPSCLFIRMLVYPLHVCCNSSILHHSCFPFSSDSIPAGCGRHHHSFMADRFLDSSIHQNSSCRIDRTITERPRLTSASSWTINTINATTVT